jgi:pimeloyl-ACP methyl ester carboxylesterase
VVLLWKSMVGIDSTFSHVDGSVFHVTTFGDRSGAGGSPLAQAAGVGTEDGCIVLVQGHGGTKTGWRPLAEDFASRGYFVITFDNRGVGCTTVLGQDDFDMTDATNPRAALFTYSDMADDVVQLMDHFHVQRAHIAGDWFACP